VICAKTAELIKMPFGTWTRVRPRKHTLHGGAHWCNLSITTEPSMCSSDAAFLSNYFDYLLWIYFDKVTRFWQISCITGFWQTGRPSSTVQSTLSEDELQAHNNCIVIDYLVTICNFN